MTIDPLLEALKENLVTLKSHRDWWYHGPQNESARAMWKGLNIQINKSETAIAKAEGEKP